MRQTFMILPPKQKFNSPDFEDEEYEVLLVSQAGDNHPNRHKRRQPAEERE